MFMDGGSMCFTYDDKRYWFDNRIRSKTKGSLFTDEEFKKNNGEPLQDETLLAEIALEIKEGYRNYKNLICFVDRNVDIIQKAEMIAEILHCRQSHGEHDYIKHLRDVYKVLMRFGFFDEDLLAASLLHDSLEDSVMKYSLIKKYFGEDVAELVYCVTHELGRNRDEKNKKTYSKIASNQKAIILKLADRIANVESSKENGSTMFDKYKEEYTNFFNNLYNEQVADKKENLMWAHLYMLLFGVPDEVNKIIS